MTLPTPPGTSHREKENRSPGSRVAWSEKNQYFFWTSGHCVETKDKSPTAEKQPPAKSILKKPSQALLPLEDERHVTPEPEDLLIDLTYLESSVSKIIALDASLRELIEAYSVLAARLRSTIPCEAEADTSWPLFQPLRKNQDAIASALSRDLGRALVDPRAGMAEVAEPPCEERDQGGKSGLPSPQSTPQKQKKKGMSAEHAKYARDLCTISHAVMKLLGVIFVMPAVFRIFSTKQLGDILTHVLAIPLADTLPTPNARKTYALSIWLLQVQRLPEDVLCPAKDRIAYALRRGVEGELGKEGKKGSMCDGLKAIHELSVFQPSTFVPAFVSLLPSILSNLLGPTLLLRTQACHALGGIALGSLSLPSSYLHTRISQAIASFLTTVTSSPSSLQRISPKRPSSDAMIVRTLRTTLSETEPQHAAQGPAWALSVLASFIILLGPALRSDQRLARIVSALLSLTMRHKKSSVRGIGCLLWRCITWVYFRPPLAQEPKESESESGDDETSTSVQCKVQEANQLAREGFWKLVRSVLDMGSGTAIIAALLAESDSEKSLKEACSILKTMANKGGATCQEAMHITRILVSFSNSDKEWNLNQLLPTQLFAAMPGILTAEFKSLAFVVRPILDECLQAEDVRSLTREEAAREWVFHELIEIWKSGLASVQITNDARIPHEVLAIWEGLLKAKVAMLNDSEDQDEMLEFVSKAALVLADILLDSDLDISPKTSQHSDILPSSPAQSSSSSSALPVVRPLSGAAMKLAVVRRLWAVMHSAIPRDARYPGCAKLLDCLTENETVMIEETDYQDDARKQWAHFCAELLVVSDVDDLKNFWDRRARAIQEGASDISMRNLLWSCFVEKWRDSADGTWESATILLGIPFTSSNGWELTNEDFEAWDNFLRYAMSKALDYGVDSAVVLDHVAEAVSQNPCPGFVSTVRIVDLLLTHLDMQEARQIPTAMLDFVNDILVSTYPPEPRNKVTSIWMIRSLTRVVDACPPELVMGVLESLQDGLCAWISDEYHVFVEDEYIFDVLPLYQTTLLGVQSLPTSIKTIEILSSLLFSVFQGRQDKPSIATESFEDFWKISYGAMEKPVHGWPEKIEACLSALGHSVTHTDSDNETAQIKEAECLRDAAPNVMSLVEVNDEKSIPVIITSAENDNFESAGTTVDRPVSPVFSWSQLSTPPKTSGSAPPSTPPRPKKSVALSDSTRTPSSPLPFIIHSPSTPPRTLEMDDELLNLSPNKRRKLENKENISPRGELDVMEEKVTPRSTGRLDTVLGKRRALDGHQDTGIKRGKIHRSDLLPESDSEDELTIASSLLSASPNVNTVFTSRAASDTPNPSAKKRKRVFMDAVEVPTLKEVQQRWLRRASQGRLDEVATQCRRSLRRVVSMPERADEVISSGPSSRMKRRRWDEVDDVHSEKESLCLEDLDGLEIVGSDDSIILAVGCRNQAPSDEASSDDNPHLGQVTPHHLVSPALRRGKTYTIDPPSDDSDMPSSPSHDLAARRKQRIFSLQDHKFQSACS